MLSVVERGTISVPPRFFSLIAIIAITNTALLNMIMASRVTYGMARQGVIPTILSRTHNSRRTPYMAILLTTAIALFLVLYGQVSDLANTTTALLLIVFTLVNVAVLVLRRDPVEHSHFRVPSLIPILGAIVCPILLTQLLWDQDREFFVIMGVLLAVGLVLGLFNFFAGGSRRTLDASQLEG